MQISSFSLDLYEVRTLRDAIAFGVFSLDLYEVRTLRDAIAFGVACRRHGGLPDKIAELAKCQGARLREFTPGNPPFKALCHSRYSNAVSVAQFQQLTAQAVACGFSGYTLRVTQNDNVSKHNTLHKSRRSNAGLRAAHKLTAADVRPAS